MATIMDENEQSSDKPFVIENNVILGRKKPFDLRYTNSGECLYNIMKNNPDVIAQLDHITGKEDTMRQLMDEAVKCALWLKKEGVRKGDVVSLMSHNNRYSFVTCLATLFIGAVFNPWDPGMNTYLARHFIRLAEPKVIFTQQKSAKIVLDAMKIENSEAKVVTFGNYPGSVSFLDVLQAHSEWDVADFQCEETDSNQTAVIMFSSGTTGLPKGVELRHKTVLSMINEGIENNIYKQPTLWFSTLYWIGGFMTTVKVLAACSKRIIVPEFEPRTACELVEKYKATCILLSPSMANLLIRYKDIGNHDLSSLKIAFVGGAIMAAESQEIIKKVLSHTMIIQVFGMTELGGVATAQMPNDTLGSSGTVCANYDLKIIDLQLGESLGPNQQGELCARSEFMMKGYYRNPTATKEAIDEDGWVHSGDLAYYNERGELFIVDRLKEILKYRGYQISPSAIETLLQTHPGVIEAVVVGIRHATDDEHPIAFVRRAPDKKVSAEELMMMVEENFGDAYKLRGGVKFVTNIPYTNSGKVARSELRNIAKSFARH